jgi:hypothetical protein
VVLALLPVTLLFARTGVGKSSLVRAAVIPTLTDKHHLDVVYHASWTQDPLQSLKAAVKQTLINNDKISGQELKDTDSLPAFMETCTAYASEPLILILDQFEDFFQYHG